VQKTQNAMNTVLLVEDRDTLRRSLKRIMLDEGWQVYEADSLKAARSNLNSVIPNAIVTDLRLPDGLGTDLLTEAANLSLNPPVILITAYGTIETAVKAIKMGAYDFLMKPVDSQHLLLLVRRAIEESKRRWRYESLMRKYEAGGPVLIGTDPVFRSAVERAKDAAQTDTTVLLLGESGTGKELLARLIHQESARNTGAFVPVNCATISPNLAESVLFGHEKGAFTGATSQHRGWFELAHNGTLFLDEIGDFDFPLQGKLLRVLEEKAFQRVGGTKWIKVDVRIIAASNKVLEREVYEGGFRSDLYYRLAVFPLTLPPLRERIDDIPLLADYFKELHGKRLRKHDLSIDESVFEDLKQYHWPGNIRELSNIIERAVIISRSRILDQIMVPISRHTDVQQQGSYPPIPLDLKNYTARTIAKIERDLIRAALDKTAWNHTRAAKLLGITYRTLLNKMKHLSIERERL